MIFRLAYDSVALFFFIFRFEMYIFDCMLKRRPQIYGKKNSVISLANAAMQKFELIHWKTTYINAVTELKWTEKWIKIVYKRRRRRRMCDKIYSYERIAHYTHIGEERELKKMKTKTSNRTTKQRRFVTQANNEKIYKIHNIQFFFSDQLAAGMDCGI